MSTDITGNEPSLSGEYDQMLREAWFVYPLMLDTLKWISVCIGIYPRQHAMDILLNACEYHWPGKCKWDGGQLLHEDDYTNVRGFLWDPKRPKR